MKKSILSLFAFILTMGLSSTAYAVVANSSDMVVTVTAVPTCTFNVTNLSFPNYDGFIDVTATSTVEVNCPTGVAYMVSFDAGLHPTAVIGFYSFRQMKDGAGNLIPYGMGDPVTGQLLGDAGLAGTFPDGVAIGGPGYGMGAVTGTGAPQTWTIDGFIPSAGAPVSAAVYSDTVTVELNL